jgi:hypothetical protein
VSVPDGTAVFKLAGHIYTIIQNKLIIVKQKYPGKRKKKIESPWEKILDKRSPKILVAACEV